jgi:uncharacterized membrane protein YccC
MKAALAGFFTIGLGVAFGAWLVPEEELRRPLWLFVFMLLAACAWFCWTHPRRPKTPMGWLLYSAVAVGVGAIFSGIDGRVYGDGNGRVMIDFAFALLGCLVAISGAVHSFFKGEGTNV